MAKLPGPLRLTPSFPFAGRSRELATLRTLIPRAEGEGLRFALIGGEAGSGKSRLVREFAHEAAAAGALVLYGACDSVVRRPYGPFVEAIEQLVRSIDEGTLRRRARSSRARSSRGCCRTWPSASVSCRLRSRPIPTPSATVCTARSRDLLAAAGRRGAAGRRDRGWPLGRHADAAAPAPPGPRRRRGARAGGHHVPRHRG